MSPSLCLVLALLFGLPGAAFAQLVTTQTPFQRNGASFYESSRIGWSVHNPHYLMRFNGGAVPPFGNYQATSGLRSGFAVGDSRLQFEIGQGASFTSTSVVPVLTTTDGYPGSLFAGTQRPFVTGLVPVAGGGFAGAPGMGPLATQVATGQLRLEGGRIVPPLDAAGVPPAPAPEPAKRPVKPIAPPRDLTASDYLQRAVAAEKQGRPGVARIYYQLAATRGDSLLKAEVARKLDELNGESARGR